jgi:DNA-binding Lrp family transcriptional regulator
MQNSRAISAQWAGFLALHMRVFYSFSTHHARIPQMLDSTDLRLLTLLQRDAHLTAQELGEKLNLSPSQAGRRRQRLEAEGYIDAYVARLAPVRLGLAIQAFVQVQMATHDPAQTRDFTALVAARNEITSAWTLTGEADYLLRVYCSDLAELHRLIHEVLLPHPSVMRVQSQIVMDQFKQDGPLPTRPQ